MTPTPQSASGAPARHDAVEQAKPQEAAGPFVLNLCSSTTPMALSNPELAELKRFSFFVSRRFEEGRERFRLHMGYFSTLAEAEEWLGAVRDIYPGAWAGEAPGKKLRERAAAAAAAQAQHAAGPPPLVVPTARPAAAAPATARGVAAPVAHAASTDAPVLNVPTVHAATAPRRPAPAATAPAPRNVASAGPAPSVLHSAPVAKPAPIAARAPVASPASAPSVIGMMRTPKAAPTAPKAAPVVPVATPRPTAPVQARPAAPPSAVAPPSVSAQRPAATAAGRPAVPAAARPAPIAQAHSTKPAYPKSNVREVLKALDEGSTGTETTGQTRMMPAPALAGPDTGAEDNNFSDTQVLKFLETRRADGSELTGMDVETGAISLLKPDDTGTRRALKQAVSENAPVWFAVQLQWSVQPVELSKVPPLAIFSAYTLYTVEGSRDGRRWFGLRLGFFSDAISAKQVAYYVRSEFTSVAVVPVSPQERTRASDVEKKAEIAFPKKARSGPVDEFKLIDSDDAQQVPTPRRPAAASKPAVPVRSAPPAAATARRTTKASTGRVRAREQRSPQTLEETLEILGASQLEMDNGNGETLNESGVRHLRVEVQKNTPFGRLLERLSEKVRKP